MRRLSASGEPKKRLTAGQGTVQNQNAGFGPDISINFVVSGQSPPNSTVTVSGKTCTIVSDGTAASASMLGILTTTKTYRIVGSATVTSGAVTLRAGGTAVGEFTTINSSGSFDLTLLCQTSANFDVVRSGACNVTINIARIYEVL